MVNPLVIQVPGASTDTTLPVLRKDGLLKADANNVIRFLADFGGLPGYAGGAPSDAQVIADLSDHADAAFVKAAGEAVSYEGGGLDFTGTTLPHYVQVPASVAADIWTPIEGVSQRPLLVHYGKMPTLANWPTGSGLVSLMVWDTYQSQPDIAVIAYELGALGRFTVRRQTGLNAFAALVAQPTPEDYGDIYQIAYWETETLATLRLRTPNGVRVSTAAKPADNSQDYSAKTGKIGAPPTAMFGSNGPGRNGRRIYRAFIGNLARDPDLDVLALLEADWARTMARGVFS